MSELVGAAAIRAAADRLRDVVIRTPLLPAPWLDEELGAEVRLKCENLQRAGAFKIRGAYNAVASLTDEERARGVIAYSSGNHAQGVALAAKLFGIRAVVVMPTTAPRVKLDGARALGADVVLEGTTSVERQERAEAIAAEQGLTIIPAFDDARTIAGQGTAGVEIAEDWPEAEVVLVPVGGGGLISGIAAWIRDVLPGCRIIGVEPEHANAMQQSIRAGHPVTIQAHRTVADGLMPVRPGDLNVAHALAFVDEVVTVSDDAIIEATGLLLQKSKLVVEFSGAATVAALRSGAFDARGLRTVAVLSGGNLDPVRALELLAARSEPPPTLPAV
ncbi:MAG TPA: threonine/serine dehydratase [Longimicrobiales bacterium]|nr:threonine/serine dehydratase [Longimicrobiales bacterium]